MINKKTLIICYSIFLLIALVTFVSCNTGPYPDLIDDFEVIDDLIGTAPAGWEVGVDTDYTGGDEDGPLIKKTKHHPDATKALFLMQEAIAGGEGEEDPGIYGYGYTGYTYAQEEITVEEAGDLVFDFQSCGWTGAEGLTKALPQCQFDFWLDLDLADIETATSPDWSRPDEMNYEDFNTFATAVIPIDEPGTYRLTWRAKKDTADIFEDRAAIDDIWFYPTGTYNE